MLLTVLTKENPYNNATKTRNYLQKVKASLNEHANTSNKINPTFLWYFWCPSISFKSQESVWANFYSHKSNLKLLEIKSFNLIYLEFTCLQVLLCNKKCNYMWFLAEFNVRHKHSVNAKITFIQIDTDVKKFIWQCDMLQSCTNTAIEYILCAKKHIKVNTSCVKLHTFGEKTFFGSTS